MFGKAGAIQMIAMVYSFILWQHATAYTHCVHEGLRKSNCVNARTLTA